MNNIKTLDEFLRLDAHHLADTTLSCPFCGAVHSVPFREIHLGRGIIETVPEMGYRILADHPQRAVVLYDQAIEPFITENVLQPIQELKLPVTPIALGQAGHLLDLEDKIGNQAAERINPPWIC